MRVLSTLMLTLVSVDTLAAGTLADLENSTPRNPTMQDSTRLSAGEEARINAQLYDRMMKMARNSREPSVINAYLELARKIKTGVNSRSDETIELQNRVSFYDDLLNTLPASEMRDDFYYELASSNDKLGNIDRAVELLDQMLKRFPNTRFASESHFRIAESLFSRGKFTDALREYSLVLNNGNDRYWQQAQYQLAWAYYKDGRYDDAVGPFERLIDSLQAKYQLSKGEQLRLDDSYNTLSRVFVQLGGAPALTAHFDKRELTKDEIRIYKAVSDRYREQQQPFDVAQTYENFIQRHPLAVETADFNRELIKVYKDAGFAKDIIRVKSEYIQRFDTDSAYFQQASPALQATLRPELKANLDDLAKHYHASAQTNKSPAEYLKAADLYRKQLALTTEPADQVRINELMADALYSGGQFEAAIPIYEQLAYDHIGSKPADAGYFALLGYQARLKQLPDDQQLAWLDRQKDSSLRFVKTFASDKNSAPVLLAMTGQYLTRKDFATVCTLAQQLLVLPALSAADRKTAAILLANARFDQQQWAEAETAYRHVLTLGDLNREENTRYQNQLAASLYRQADALQTTDFSKASTLYQQASDTTQDIKVKVDAAWRAAMVMGETTTAIPQLQAFYARYALNEQAIGILERIVGIQEKSMDWQGASRTYQQIYQRDTRSKPDNALAALWLAADSERKAIDTGTTPRTSLQSTAETALYRQYLAEPRADLSQSIEASERLYQDALQRHDTSNQQQELNRQLQWASKLNAAPVSTQPRLRYLAARAHTLLDQPLIEQYRAIAITQPLKDSIARKQASLQKLLASQQAILDLKVAEFVTPAQYVLGDSFARFYQGVNAAPVPTGMSDLDAEQYQITIEEQTQPLKDKAIEWHKANATLATLPDGALWDTWIAKSFEALAGLSAGYYQRDLHRPNIPASDTGLQAGFSQLDAGQFDSALKSAEALITARSVVIAPPPAPTPVPPTKKVKNRKTTVVVVVPPPVAKPDPTPLAQARLLKAFAQMKLGHFTDADLTLTQAIVDLPTMTELTYTQGINRELYLKQAQGALDAYTQYLSLVGTDKSVQKWINLLQKQLNIPLTSFAKPASVVPVTDTPIAALPATDAPTHSVETSTTAPTPPTAPHTETSE